MRAYSKVENVAEKSNVLERYEEPEAKNQKTRVISMDMIRNRYLMERRGASTRPLYGMGASMQQQTQMQPELM